MEKLKRYIAFVNETAVDTHRKQVRAYCVSLVLLIVLGELVVPFAGFQLSLTEKIIILLLSILTYITYLPVFSLLPSVLCLITVLMSPISMHSISRLYVVIFGMCCFAYTNVLYKAFKKQEEGDELVFRGGGEATGASDLSAEEVRFRGKIKCSNCGSMGLEVFSAKCSRSIISRLTSVKEGWTTYCPQCHSYKAVKHSEIKKIALDSGQFSAYKRAVTFDGWLAAFASFALAFIASGILLAVITVSQSAVYSADVSSPKLDVGKQFVGEDLLLLDCFAANVNNNQNVEWADTEDILALHMIACLKNENGVYFIPVKIEAGHDLFMRCLEYVRYENRDPIISNVHGYVGSITGEALQLFTDMAQGYADYDPQIIAVKNEIIYWDNESVPNDDKSDLRIFRIIVISAGMATAVFFALDKYVNSEEYSEEVQNRYDRKRHD